MEDAASMAKTRNMNAQDAAAMFSQLEADLGTAQTKEIAAEEVVPESVRSAEVAQLDISQEGVLSVHTLSESVILEVMQLIGEEELQAAISGEDGQRKRTALGLPKPAPRVLKPIHVHPHVGDEAARARTRSEAPELATQSVDQLEVTLSDALTAQGIPTIDQLPWRRGTDESGD